MTKHKVRRAHERELENKSIDRNICFYYHQNSHICCIEKDPEVEIEGKLLFSSFDSSENTLYVIRTEDGQISLAMRDQLFVVID
jgi:hypothetical protein